MGARRNRAVIDEADIIDDYAPRRKRGRWADRSVQVDERRPANPWVGVALEGYTPARPVEPVKKDWPDLGLIYEERPPYSLQG
jgi:hypothetical protein